MKELMERYKARFGEYPPLALISAYNADPESTLRKALKEGKRVEELLPVPKGVIY